MKKHLAILALTLVTLGILSRNVCGQSLFVWGNVKWATGYPAIAIEVRLVQNDNTVRSTAYTNQTGSYAFFGIEGRPSDYYVMVYSRGSVLGQIRVPEIPVGRQVPEIRLTSKILKVSVVAVPETVAVGQKTVITVTVRDENGQPVPNATTTISAGGGKFLSPGESYDPTSRLHGPYTATGLTDTRGIYATSWVCNPCARAYGLRVEGSKDNYIMSASDLTIDIRQ
jgi:hypothetical protein